MKVVAVLFYAVYVLYKRYPARKLTSLQWFYVAIAITGVCSSLINDSFYQPQYALGFYLGLFQWGVAFAISYLLLVTVSVLTKQTILRTLKVFFTINAVISLVTLLVLFAEAGFKVPYWLTSSIKYGVSTGDYINGIFNDTSVTNAAINALGAIFFLYYKEFRWAALCTFIMLLCTSNVTVVFMTVVLLAMFFKKDKAIKRNAVLLILMMAVSYPILSPQNLKYIEVVYEREKKDNYEIGLAKLKDKKITVSSAAKEEDFFDKKISSTYRGEDYQSWIKAYKYYPYRQDIESPVFNSKEYYLNIKKYKMGLKQEALTNLGGELYQLKDEATKEKKDGEIGDNDEESEYGQLNPFALQTAIANWYHTPASSSVLNNYNMPGKLYTNMQTLYFLRSNTTHMFFGAGIGNFSSKLAIKMTGLGLQGSYPPEKIYVNRDFLQYHFYTLLFYLSRHAAEHSVMNMPNSTYNQIVGEYGLIGFVLFLVLYVGFVLKRRKRLQSGVFIAAIVFMFLGMEYWFELLSLTVVFELLIMSELFAKTENDTE